MSPLSIEKVNRGSRRLQEIVTILAKYQLADWLGSSGPEFLHAWLKGEGGKDLRNRSTHERIRLALEELGPTFIKLGQMCSTRPDIVGSDLARELKALQKGVPSDPPEEIRELLEAELEASPEDCFAEFSMKPEASASIAQVHRARLKDGAEVAVKVQHPGIRDTIDRDLEVLSFLAGLAEKHSDGLKQYRPSMMVEEFRRNIIQELDFRREMRNLEVFRENFDTDGNVRIPEPFPDITTQHVLTMEYLEGLHLSDTEALEQAGVDKAEVVRLGAKMYLDMIFRDGFFHADPHPGNLLVLENGAIGLLDCGSTAFLSDSTQRDLEDIFLNVVSGDAEQLMEALTRFGTTPHGLDRAQLRSDLSFFTAEFSNQTLETFDASKALTELLRIVQKHRILLRPGIAVLLKTLIELEGTARELDAKFSLAQLIQPYYEEAERKRLSPSGLARRMRSFWVQWEKLASMLPKDLGLILRRLKEGDLQVYLRHNHLDATVNRLTQGVLTAALIMASSLLLAQRVPPLVKDLSVLGLGTAAAAAWLGLGLLRAMRRSGGLDHGD